MKFDPTTHLDRADLMAVLLAHYPAAYRLAVGLSGGADRAGRVARRVLDRAVVLGPRWASDEAAERWFLRFTVLTSREAGSGGEAEAELAWLRPLPGQQREAIVLRHGLGLDLHRMAAAMDCSTTAASNHLVAGTAALRATGPVDAWTARLPDRLAAVVPPAPVVAAQVVRAVRRRRWRGAARRWAIVTIAAGAGWVLWHLWGMLVI